MYTFYNASTIFVSDVHIFANHPENMILFSQFLSEIENENIYRSTSPSAADPIELFLLGDIFDIWFLNDSKRNPSGLDRIGDIEREVFHKIRSISESTKVTMILGNHDEIYRKPAALDRMRNSMLPNVEIVVDHDVYTTKKNKKIFLTHGDKFDPFMYLPRFLIRGADRFKFLRPLQKIVYKFWGPRSLLKIKVRLNSEYAAAMCGHTHNPMIEHNYLNTGDWVDHHSYIVENDQGNLSLEIYGTKYRKVCNNRGEIVVPIKPL